jgi:hypothetical protein
MTVQSLPPPALVVRKAALALCILLGLLDGPAAFIEVPTSCQPSAGCGDIDLCKPCICERLSTPSAEGYARIMLRGSITLKTAVDVSSSI